MPKHGLFARAVAAIADSDSGHSSAGHAAAHPAGHGDEWLHITTGGFVVFALMATLLLGAALQRLKPYLPVPFTLCMLLIGMGVGGLTHGWEWLDQKLEPLDDMEPQLVLDIFLPVLIFEGARSLRVAVLDTAIYQCLLLAGPGVLFNATLVSVFLKTTFFTGWTWAQAFLFGSIMSATDPVAVVATLKDLDADIGVTVLTDGEAIMNDGTAIVLFSVLRDWVQEGTIDTADPLLYIKVLDLILLPVPLGLLFGFLMFIALKHSHGHAIVSTMVQVAGAYVAFFIADAVIRTSGVLTLLVMGVFISEQRGKLPRTNREEETEIHGFWEILVWMANCLIFWIAGYIITSSAVRNASRTDWIASVVLYVALHVIRFLMLLMILKPMNLYATLQVTWSRLLMLVHGALRGAIALVLALIVFQDPEIVDTDFRNSALFITGAVVFLTIAVNGSTARYVVQLLHMNLKPPFAIYAFKHAQQEISAAMEMSIRAHQERTHTHLNWPAIRRLTQDSFDATRLHGDIPGARGLSDHELIVPTLLRAMKRELFLRRDAGLLSGWTFECLIKAFDRQISQGEFTSADGICGALVGRPPGWMERTQLRLLGDVKFPELVFARSGSTAITRIEGMTAYAAIMDSVCHTVRFLLSRHRNLLQLSRWIMAERERARERLLQLQNKDPVVINAQTKLAAQSTLWDALGRVETVAARTGLSVQQEAALHHELHHLIMHTARSDPTDYEFSLPALLGATPFFRKLTAEHLRLIAELVVAKSHKPSEGEEIVFGRDGTEGFGIILVGTVAKVLGRKVMRKHYQMDCFGMMRALGARSARLKFIAMEQVEYLYIDGAQFQALLDDHLSLKRHVWLNLGIDCVEEVLAASYPTSALQPFERHAIARHGEVTLCDVETSYRVRDRETALLLKGHDLYNGFNSKAGHILPRGASGIVNEGAVLFTLSDVRVQHTKTTTHYDADSMHGSLNTSFTSFTMPTPAQLPASHPDPRRRSVFAISPVPDVSLVEAARTRELDLRNLMTTPSCLPFFDAVVNDIEVTMTSFCNAALDSIDETPLVVKTMGHVLPALTALRHLFDEGGLTLQYREAAAALESMSEDIKTWLLVVDTARMDSSQMVRHIQRFIRTLVGAVEAPSPERQERPAEAPVLGTPLPWAVTIVEKLTEDGRSPSDLCTAMDVEALLANLEFNQSVRMPDEPFPMQRSKSRLFAGKWDALKKSGARREAASRQSISDPFAESQQPAAAPKVNTRSRGESTLVVRVNDFEA